MRWYFIPFLLAADPAWTDCFDETLIVSRYHYPNPANINQNFQDLYLLDYPGLPSVIPTVLKLTDGFNANPRHTNTDPAFSSDGTRLVFVSSRIGGYSDLFVMDPRDSDQNGEGDNLVQVSNDNFERFGLDWGISDLFAYVSEEHGYETAVATLNASGAWANEVVLTNHSAETSPADLSPLGDYVIAVFEETPFPMRTHSLRAIKVSDGSTTILVSDGVVNQSPSLTSDQQTLYFTSTRAGGVLDIFEAPVDLSANPPSIGSLTNVTNSPTLSESDVKVSPDGQCLAFIASDLVLSYGPNSDLYIVDISSQTMQRMTSTRDIGSFAWAPTVASESEADGITTLRNASKEIEAVRCTEFDSSALSIENINGAQIYRYVANLPSGSANIELCTKSIPPLTSCNLTGVAGVGQGAACSIFPTKGLVNNGRWSFLMKNANTGASISCEMACVSN